MKRLLIVTLFCLLISSMTSCKPPDKEPEQGHLRTFDFLIDWQPEPTYLGIYYARHIGAFKKLGLDVNIVPSWGANQAVASVAAGRYKISTASGGATVLGFNQGEQIVSLAVLYPRISSVVYGLSDSSIHTPNDLLGKRIGIYPGSVTKNEFDAFLKINNIDPKQLSIVSISGSDLSLLLAHKVDGVLHYSEMAPVSAEVDPAVPGGTPGQPKTYQLSLSKYGVRGYGLNIITSRASYDHDSALLRQVAAAAVEGYKAGCAAKADAVDEFLKEFPQKNADYVRESWDRVCALVGTEPGEQNEKGWQETIDQYQSLNLLHKAPDPKRIMP